MNITSVKIALWRTLFVVLAILSVAEFFALCRCV